MHEWVIRFFRHGSDGLREIGVRAPCADAAIDAARTITKTPIVIVYVIRGDVRTDELGNLHRG